MKCLIRLLTCLLLAGASVLPTLAAGPALQPYAYHEGFEGEFPEPMLWATNGDATVAFMGPTDEVAFEGKRSLKLDVTLGEGSYWYWGLPLSVPIEGPLRLSGRLRLGAETRASVGFGYDVIFPPSDISGCGPLEQISGAPSDWRLIEGNLQVAAAALAQGLTSKLTLNVRGENVGRYLDRWSLFIYGAKGDRVVVYLDDVRVEGQTPAENDYRAEIARRWAPVPDALRPRIAQWRTRLNAIAEPPALAPGAPAIAARLLERARDALSSAHEAIRVVELQGFASRKDVDAIEASLTAATNGPAIVEAAASGQAYLLAPSSRAIRNPQISDEAFPVAQPLQRALRLSACRGEYEPGLVTVYAFRDTPALRVRATDLWGIRGTIPADAFDIKIVKKWYQGAGGGIIFSPKKTLVPELLLNDDSLVRVDAEAGENYVRSTAPDGSTQYLLCSGRESANLADLRPVQAEVLQPAHLAADTARQFWVTVRVPETAPAGRYRGELIFSAGADRVALPVIVTVHPFDLSPSRLIYSIYYRGVLTPDGEPTISSEGKSEAQYRAEMENMKAHGVLHPTIYQGWDEELLPRSLQIRQEVGMPGGPLFSLGIQSGNNSEPAALQRLRDSVMAWRELAARYGYDQLYVYGIDEATGKLLESQRLTWRAVQEAGGKTFVACYAGGTFEAMGSLLNLAVLAGTPDPEQARLWHSVGSLAFCYSNPQAGVEAPETYRRNFGLLLWKAGFDGAMNYAYQHSFGHIWNDFDDRDYRDHNFTYPTVTGVIDTVQWEGFREGVDDVRYVTTLEEAIAATRRDDPVLAAQAQDWLDRLDPSVTDPYQARDGIVRWITRLRKTTASN